MDVLSDVLAAVRLTGAIYFDIDAGVPFVGETPDSPTLVSMIMPQAEHVICFHAVISGSCWAAVGDKAGAPVAMGSGDIVVFPKGNANVMSSLPGARGQPDMDLYRRAAKDPLPFNMVHGSSGDERTRFVCGFLGCDLRPFNPLLAALPEIMVARRPEGAGAWVSDLLLIALSERDRQRAGTETVLAKLSELVFIEVIRRYIESLPEDARGWLSGLRDPHVGAALGLIHERPLDDWTLEGLARAVGLSRTTFADRFAHYAGVSPMLYLTRWRMQLAARRLDSPDVGIAQVAAEIGYESEAAFNRAFKKAVGQPPGAWRRSRRPATA